MKTKRLHVIGVILCVVLSGIFVVMTSKEVRGSLGTTRYVGGSGPGNYSSIQSAINATNNGDTVFVYGAIFFDITEK